MMPHEQYTRVSFPRSAWAVMGLAVLLMLCLLASQLKLLLDQRALIRDQRAIASRQLRESLPVFRDARPVTRAVRESLPRARLLVDRSLALTREARPLVDELRANDVGEAARTVGRLAEGLLRADSPEVVTSFANIADELVSQQRLRRLLVRGTAVLGEVRSRHLVAKLARASELMPEVVSLQRQALAIATEALAVAREAERHAESLDRKLGGTPPGGAG